MVAAWLRGEGPSNLLGGGCTLHATRHRTRTARGAGTGETQAAGEGLGARARKGARSGSRGDSRRAAGAEGQGWKADPGPPWLADGALEAPTFSESMSDRGLPWDEYCCVSSLAGRPYRPGRRASKCEAPDSVPPQDWKPPQGRLPSCLRPELYCVRAHGATTATLTGECHPHGGADHILP